MTITSEVEQEVWVTAHTWDDRSLADGCKDYLSEKKHSIKVPHDPWARSFRYGSHQLEKFTIAAGESVQVTTEWNWTDPNHPKDWSVTVWAKDGPVTVTNNNGRTSDVFPVINADGTSTNSSSSGSSTNEGSSTNGDSSTNGGSSTSGGSSSSDDTSYTDNGSSNINNNIGDGTANNVSDPTPAPAPEDPITAMLNDPEYQAFIEWAEAYTPDTGGYPCGGGLLESYSYVDGVRAYRTAMVNTCESWNLEYTVTMSKEDWDEMQFFYTTYDES